MERKEAEQAILAHLLEIRKIVLEYSPDDIFLSAAIVGVDHVSAYNRATYDPKFKNKIDIGWYEEEA